MSSLFKILRPNEYLKESSMNPMYSQLYAYDEEGIKDFTAVNLHAQETGIFIIDGIISRDGARNDRYSYALLNMYINGQEIFDNRVPVQFRDDYINFLISSVLNFSVNLETINEIRIARNTLDANVYKTIVFNMDVLNNLIWMTSIKLMRPELFELNKPSMYYYEQYVKLFLLEVVQFNDQNLNVPMITQMPPNNVVSREKLVQFFNTFRDTVADDGLDYELSDVFKRMIDKP